MTSYLERIRANGNGISDDEPWQGQLFIEEGTKMSCSAVLRDSRLELFTCCLSSASQLRYVHAGRTTPAGNEEDSSAASDERNRSRRHRHPIVGRESERHWQL